MTDFYNKCNLIDETIKYNDEAFWNDDEQIRSNKQCLLAGYAHEAAKLIEGNAGGVTDKDAETVKYFDDITEKFDKVYMSKQDRFGYTPQKTLNDAKLYIGEINLRISQSSVGTKLKKLANIKSRL